jgi:tripeptidyl-peptidase-1
MKLLLLLCAVGLVDATLVLVEGPSELPAAWKTNGMPAPHHMIELTFAVKQRGLQELHDHLMRVSNPFSKEYGMHLSTEEVHTLTAPAPESIAIVEDFLRRHGAHPHAGTPNKDFIVATVSVSLAEEILSTKYVRLVHQPSGIEVVRAPGGYLLPHDVAAVVDFVAPTTHVPGARMPQESAAGNDPKTLRHLYEVTAEGKAPSNKQAVTAFLKQLYRQDDLEKYWSTFCDANMKCGKGLPKLVGDATNGTRSGVESMLDIEVITSVSGNVESEFWGFSGVSEDNPENEPFMKWLELVGNTSDAEVPLIFSTSYGEDENSWSPKAAQRLNAEFQKVGVRGISLLFASGDSGANCHSGRFYPSTPASSPWVTAVGGTRACHSYPDPGNECAISLSGCGFSDYWAMPDWQKSAVSKYLENPDIPPPAQYGYNTSGRAFPDVSAQATNFPIYVNGYPTNVAGTSCSCPVVSAIFGLLNDLRLQNGKSPLGFLNPLIYSNPAGFNDITEGSSSGCGGPGFPAKPGWDAVTGFGTPSYEKLAKIVLALPAGRNRRY